MGFLSGSGSRLMMRRGAPGTLVKKVKLLMLGDSGVGKSSLVERFTDDHFNPNTVRMVMPTAVLTGGEVGDGARGNTVTNCDWGYLKAGETFILRWKCVEMLLVS